MGVFHVFQIVQMVLNRAKHHISLVLLYERYLDDIIEPIHLEPQHTEIFKTKTF